MSDYYLQKKWKSARKNSKIFSDSEEIEHPQLRNAQRRKPKAIQELIKFPSPNIQYVDPYVPGPPSIPEAIKQIDKKIMAYRKVMEIAQKQKQIQEQQKKLETEEEEKKEIDYLTNPQVQVDQCEKCDDNQNETTAPPLNQIKSQEMTRQAKQWSYSETVQRRNQIYENTILRLYEKRQNPAFFAKLKKKTPALNITSKNKISLGSGRIDPEEHKLRVYNRENVPTMPELMIPSFMIKKDSMAKNILAYLVNYNPNSRKITPQCTDSQTIKTIQNVYKIYYRKEKIFLRQMNENKIIQQMSNIPASQQPWQATAPAPQQPQWNATFSPPRAYQAPVQLQSPGYIPQYYTQPITQSVVAQPVVQQPVVYQQPAVYQQPIVQQSVVAQPVVSQQPVIKGESRVEYIPYEKSYIEYEEVRQKIQVPREKIITEYQAIEYQTEYVPQVYYDKVTEYVAVDRFQDRVEYYPVERQIVHPPQVQTKVVAQPVVTQSVVAQPVVTQQVVPQQVVTQSFVQQPVVTQSIPYVQQPVQYASVPQYYQQATSTIYGPQIPLGTQPIPASQLPNVLNQQQQQQTPQRQ